jgi:hypothetical protein
MHLLRGVILWMTAKVNIGLNASCAKNANTDCANSEAEQCVCLSGDSNERPKIETNNNQ